MRQYSIAASLRMEMQAGVARRLFAEGAVLVLVDVPERTEVGIDYNCWTVGPRFRGIKMIPPGFHFVFYRASSGVSAGTNDGEAPAILIHFGFFINERGYNENIDTAVSRQGQPAPRTGFFHFFQSQEVLVKRWDPRIEDLTEEGITAQTVERVRAGLRDLDSSLGPYPYDSLKKWVSLTNHISQELVARVQPVNRKISSVTQLQSEELPTPMEVQVGSYASDSNPTFSHPTSKSEEKSEEGELEREWKEEEDDKRGEEAKEAGENLTPGGVFAGVGEFPSSHKPERTDTLQLPQLKYKAEAALRFSEIPKQKYPDGATPSQITLYNMDLSYTLTTMLKRCYGNNEKEILGELQFAFICFIVGHVYDAFEHWKALVKLLCSCEEALHNYTDLFTNFISVLHFHLKEIPEDFFIDIVSRNNFLTVTLQVFFSNLESCTTASRALVKRGLQFRENLTKRYKWDFSTESDEFAPTVVDV